jgi:hypothetical protein
LAAAICRVPPATAWRNNGLYWMTGAFDGVVAVDE